MTVKTTRRELFKAAAIGMVGNKLAGGMPA